MLELFWPTAIFKQPIDPIRFDHRNRSFYVGIVPSTHCSLNMAVGQTVWRVARVPGALPLAMLRKAVGHMFWPLAMFFGQLGYASAVGDVNWPTAMFFGQRP